MPARRQADDLGLQVVGMRLAVTSGFCLFSLILDLALSWIPGWGAPDPEPSSCVGRVGGALEGGGAAAVWGVEAWGLAGAVPELRLRKKQLVGTGTPGGP